MRVAAPPAAKAVPRVNAINNPRSGLNGSCTKKPREAVKTDNKLRRGLVSSYRPLKLITLESSKAEELVPVSIFLVRFTGVIKHNDARYDPSKMIGNYKYIERKTNTQS